MPTIELNFPEYPAMPEYVRSLEESESVTSGTSKVKNSCFHDIFLRVHPWSNPFEVV